MIGTPFLETPRPSRLRRFNQALSFIPNLVAYYPLNEKPGSIVYNRSQLTKGLLNGTNSGSLQYQPGQMGPSYFFDGADDVVIIPDHDLLDLTVNFTVFAIIYPVTFGEGPFGRILDKENGTAVGYSFSVNDSNDLMTLIRNTSTTVSSSSNSITLNKWQLVGASYNGANVVYHKNSSLAGSPSSGIAATANTLALRIGNRESGDRAFHGYIQHVGLVTRVMKQAEFARISQMAGLS